MCGSLWVMLLKDDGQSQCKKSTERGGGAKCHGKALIGCFIEPQLHLTTRHDCVWTVLLCMHRSCQSLNIPDASRLKVVLSSSWEIFHELHWTMDNLKKVFVEGDLELFCLLFKDTYCTTFGNCWYFMLMLLNCCSPQVYWQLSVFCNFSECLPLCCCGRDQPSNAQAQR